MKDPMLSHSGDTKVVNSRAENCTPTGYLEADDRFLDDLNQKETVTRQVNREHRSMSISANLTARQLDKALRILRMKQMIERTNLSRATLYALAGTDPTFPRKIKLTARTVGYIEQEVEEWIMSRAQARGIVA